ncbi:GapS4a family protein [Lactococcus carnosus]|uniref:GAPS4 PD-(D/E)XK nuclease domain-containing protein n=1 Tax=Pseudolactococcus carnosus TaxID=2749961 RepID=A0ABT0ASK8_9LACT|nr:hypothetical protein [Lactococcus carnosus]MCJ1989684.1 hypothetical protein [Lactococcus carnosus]
MAGEKSKNSGEFGEKIISNFLQLIGWTSSEEGITIDCVNEQHNRKSKSHGIDGYYGYKSELLKQNTQEDILISIKHTTNEYPSSPTSLFKGYLKDISEGMECFPFDAKYIDRKIPQNIQERKIFGVIFWISQASDDSKDIIADVSNFNNTDKIDYGPVYLVDNNKLNFLLQSIKYAQNKYDDYTFEYHSTGFNHTNPAESKESGKILPVQLINTNILPIRAQQDGKECLTVFLNEGFNEDSLKRSLGFTKMLANAWPTRTFILYPDYNHLDGENTVKRVKTIFNDADFTSKVVVSSYNENIASLGRD